jgi:multidrug efflux pump subunit AcrB
VHQRLDGPSLDLQMDRTRLQQYGLTAANVGQNVLIALSGSSQTAPAFWLNPQNGVVYSIAVQTPQYNIDSLDSLLNIPVGTGGTGAASGASQQLLGNLVDARAARQPAVMSRYNIAPVIDVYVSVQGTDLASVASKVQVLVDEMRLKLSRGSQVTIAWMLFITGTTLSVPALTGAIMTMGVATANSILLVSFARERLQAGIPPLSAALEAGATRIRPVLMTALAMIIGMIPMALGLGEGAEQNAPLGRAVIGGLLFATVSTLFFVPAVFAGVHSRLAHRKAAREEAANAHSAQPPAGTRPQEN